MTQAWAHLEQHAKHLNDIRLAELLDQADRFERFSIKVDGLVGDFSRSLTTTSILDDLVELARQVSLPEKIQELVNGAMMNGTEKRAALHTALRGAGPVKASHLTGRRSPSEDVAEQLAAFLAFADSVRDGSRVGSGNQPFRHVINIGIGGSDLGPRLVADALMTASDPVIVRFVAGIDGIELRRALEGADPSTTLFIICSKTFTTLETMLNAEAAKQWLLRTMPSEKSASHFAAVSVNDPAMDKFGIASDARFRIWDWVGGRYSLWSAIGLAAAIAIGSESFKELLAGAAGMDRHFREAALRDNLPVMLALVSVWHQNFCGIRDHVVLPYDQRLQLLPAYLQQLFMESLGKSVRADGIAVDYPTGCPVWGSVGSHSQHSFAQLLHQGKVKCQVDYIAAVHGLPTAGSFGHQAGLANMLAQSESLARGQNQVEVLAALQIAGSDQAAAMELAAHKIHTGNRPSNILLMRELNAASLGALLALYEHQVYAQAVIWGINPFDQWGVELGKLRAGEYAGFIRNEEVRKLPRISQYFFRWKD